MDFQQAYYITRAGLRVCVTDSEDSYYRGYFQLRDIRIPIAWDKNGKEVHGEKGLDLMKIIVEGYDMVKGA